MSYWHQLVPGTWGHTLAALQVVLLGRAQYLQLFQLLCNGIYVSQEAQHFLHGSQGLFSSPQLIQEILPLL